jgi:hypothetical protein
MCINSARSEKMKTYCNGTAAVAFPILAILLAAVLSSCGGGAASGSPGIESGLTSNPASGGNTGSFFDAKGSTSAFGIPAGLNGTVSAGQTVFSASCSGCHGSGSALPLLAFDALKAKMQTGPMAGITLTDQQIADLTAWLNRSATPPPSTGGGTPNPGTGGTGGAPGVGTGGSGDDSNDGVADDNGGTAGSSDDVADDNGGATGGSDDVADDSGSATGGSDDVTDDNGGATGGSDDVADDSGGATGGSDDAADDSGGATGGSDDTAGGESDPPGDS